MKKTTILILLALLLVACIFPAFAEEEVAVYVDGVAIPQVLVDARLSTSSVMGLSLSDEEKEEQLARAREAVLTALIEEQVCLNDAENRGISPDPADVENRYNQSIRSVTSYIHASYPDLEGEELEEQIDAMLKVSGATRETYYLLAQRSVLMDAWKAQLLAEMKEPSEEEIQAAYDALFAEQKALFDSDENAFESAVLNSELVVYRPVTLKMIQKAEFLFDDDAISIIQTTRLYNEDAAAEMEADQYARLDEKVNPIYEELTGGKRSFASVLEELNEGSSSKYNYFHESSTRFSEDYYSRAGAFKVPGEISTMYKIRNGYAVLYYAGDLPACDAVPLEEVRDEIVLKLKAEQYDAYEQEVKESLLASAVVTEPEENGK